MKRSHTLTLLVSILWWIVPLGAQSVSGSVTNEVAAALVGATVTVLDDAGRGTTTDQSGQYQLSFPGSGSYRIIASYVGYRPDTTEVRLLSEGETKSLDFVLVPATGDLMVEVTDRYLTTERRLEMTTQRLQMDEIKQLPLILGEADVLRSLQFLPGVQTGAEGQSGLHVRGGSPD